MQNDIFRKGLVLGIIILFVGTGILPTMGINIDFTNKEIETEKIQKSSDGWWYYPPLTNYAPAGIPDFDQRQDNWNYGSGGYTWCGQVSTCDILWYLDSKYSDPNGTPGDGIDEFLLVQDYHAPSNPNPGPYSDDHNYNNVNDIATPWNLAGAVDDFEFIEQYSWNQYYNSGWPAIVNYWIDKAGLSSQFKSYREEYRWATSKFNFSEMADKIMSGDYYYMLQMELIDERGNMITVHCVAIAGINVDEMKIAVSDPAKDKQNFTNNLFEHNDIKFVSHDIYNVILNPPESKWGIDYGATVSDKNYGAVISSTVIRINYPPEKPQITGEVNGIAGTMYSYSIASRDKHKEDTLFYKIDWGDGNISDWVGPKKSEQIINLSHTWSQEGNFIIKVVVKDDCGAESDWATLEVTMPYSYDKPISPFLQILFLRFPHAFPILRQLLGN